VSDIWTSLNADHQMIGWQGCELILMPAIFISFVCLFCCPKTLLLDAAVNLSFSFLHHQRHDWKVEQPMKGELFDG